MTHFCFYPKSFPLLPAFHDTYICEETRLSCWKPWILDFTNCFLKHHWIYFSILYDYIKCLSFCLFLRNDNNPVDSSFFNSNKVTFMQIYGRCQQPHLTTATPSPHNQHFILGFRIFCCLFVGTGSYYEDLDDLEPGDLPGPHPPFYYLFRNLLVSCICSSWNVTHSRNSYPPNQIFFSKLFFSQCNRIYCCIVGLE